VINETPQSRYALAVERNVSSGDQSWSARGSELEFKGLAYGVEAARHPLEYMVLRGVVPETLNRIQTLAGRGLIQGIECGDQLTLASIAEDRSRVTRATVSRPPQQSDVVVGRAMLQVAC